MTLAVDICLAVLLLGLALWAVVARDTFGAAVGFIAYGLLLALAWVRLQAPDVALIEAAIGGGLTGALLIGAAARLRSRPAAAATAPTGRPLWVLAALVSAGIAVGLGAAMLALPDPAPGLAPEAARNLPATGVGNPVTAVLMAFRALDTLLEAIVLLFALVGVWSLAPDKVWGGRPGHPYPADPDGILAYMARLLPPVGLVVGLYIFWSGADFPGGKFQGAAIIAAMWLLVVMAGLADTPAISRTWLRVGLVAGPLAFIAIGFAGVVTAGAFLAYPAALAKPLIKAIEFALLPSLVLTLVLLLAGPPARPEQG